MATKVFKSGNYIILDDGVNEPDAIPTKDCRYSVITSQYTISDDENDLFSVVLDYADVRNEAGSNYSSEAVFLTFLRDNTGFSSGGSSSIPTGEIFNGGFADYNDSTTAGSPISLSAGVPTVLTNDGAGSFTNKTYLPTGVTDVWDEVDSFDWSDLELGDMLDIRMDVLLTTASPNTTVEVDLHLGTGGGAYTIPFVTDADFKDAGTHTINKYNGIYLGDNNTLNNGGQFKITCDKNSTVVVNGWYIKIIKRR